MGFDLLSRANNHSTDWGIKGMEDTDRVLRRAGLVHAGTGKNLAAARAPAFLATPQGRIALVAMTSSFTSMEPAGAPIRGLAGRPGANVLRTTLYHVVTAKEMKWLRQIYNSKPRKPARLATSNTDHLYLFGTHYIVGQKDNLTYKMNPYDLDANLRSIREGKEESDFEIVYIHAHNPGNWSERVADFLPNLAHDAIDSGEDEFVASGPHRLRGIEIYKGKPIFYSLGDFFFEDKQIRFLDSQLIQRLQLNFDSTTNWEYENYYNSKFFNNEIWYQSVVAVSKFDDDGDVIEVKLYPIELGYKSKSRTKVGVPELAPAKVAHNILVRLKRLSKPFGTHIKIKNNIGIIRVERD
jgi:poly-gamma-glutamate synthesis protein (capsule biosynthesis protein)